MYRNISRKNCTLCSLMRIVSYNIYIAISATCFCMRFEVSVLIASSDFVDLHLWCSVVLTKQLMPTVSNPVVDGITWYYSGHITSSQNLNHRNSKIKSVSPKWWNRRLPTWASISHRSQSRRSSKTVKKNTALLPSDWFFNYRKR